MWICGGTWKLISKVWSAVQRVVSVSSLLQCLRTLHTFRTLNITVMGLKLAASFVNT